MVFRKYFIFYNDFFCCCFRRYPEVRRVSSRFGDGKASQERVVGNLQINQTPNRQEVEKPQRRGRKKKKNRKRPRRPKTTATPFPVIIFIISLSFFK